MNFQPCFTWPNPAFPFRLYFNHENCRIFLIENIAHNFDWLRTYKDRIRPTDYFLVRLGWHFHDWLANESRQALDVLGINIDQFIILFNDYASKQTFEELGFKGCIVNQNCFLDYNMFDILDEPKRYDAIYVARLVDFKRHYLCEQVSNLALVAGNAWGHEIEDIPTPVYLNEQPLCEAEVVLKMNQSKCGLILSQAEGACYSSSEYLLCGLPVVSTWSHGGRDIWYTDYNSVICDEDPAKVAAAVREMIAKNPDPHKIRKMHIRLSESMREEFCQLLDLIFRSNGLNVDSRAYFKQAYFNKLLCSEEPDFDQLFS